MLQGIHRVGQSWAGRVVVAILFGFLIVSFAIWGIGDIFRGTVRTQVATVGKTDITADAFRSAYQNEYQALLQRTRQSITPDQARALGLDQRVLGRLVSEAVLDRVTAELGLSVSDPLVVRSIEADPAFQGANGAFDRSRFFDLIRQNNLSEAQFVREQRSLVKRLQVVESVTGDAPVPLAMREAVHRFQTERRSADYLVLGAGSVGDVAAPTDAQLQTFFDGRKGSYRAPEYRAVSVLTVDPATLAKPDAVTDEDARRVYDSTKDTRFGQPERRTVQQIVFPTPAEAEGALARLKDGLTFDALAAEKNIDPGTLTLGTFTRADMIDRAAADAAFALAEGGTSDVVSGRFGPVILRVTKVEAGALRPFEEVSGEVKREIALERARAEVQTVHDAIDDERAGAKPLAAIAAERGLALVTVPAVDRQGLDKAGQPTPLATSPALAAAFRSDVGADNEAVQLPGSGYSWFDVTGVEPARDRTLAEVRDRVAADWRIDEVARLLAEKARAVTDRVIKGETLQAVAAELGLVAENAPVIERGRAAGDLPGPAATRIFATPVGSAADTTVSDTSHVVFKVTGATVPPFDATSQPASQVQDQLRGLVADDLLAQYVAEKQKEIGVSVYPENMRRAIGGEI